MLIETGRVVAIEDDGVWIETIRQSTCGSCAAQKGCGHKLLNRISDGKHGYIKVLPGKLSARECAVDDQVRVSIPEEVILRGSLVVYLLPLLAMLAGSAAAVSWLPVNQDAAALLGALLGFGAGLGLVRLHAWHHRADASFLPTLVEVVQHGSQVVHVA